MKINIKEAFEKNDADAVGRMADSLRFKHRMTYMETFEFFKNHVPDLTLAQYDELLSIADDRDRV